MSNYRDPGGVRGAKCERIAKFRRIASMLLQDDMFPIVRIRYDLAHSGGLVASLASFEAQLARAQPFVLVGSGANRQGQDHAERRDVALWMKRHREALRRFVLALVYVEPDAADRAAAQAGAAKYEKFWGYPMLVAASDDDAIRLAARLLEGGPVGDIMVSFGNVTAIEPDPMAMIMRTTWVFAFGAALTVSGCAVGPDFTPPTAMTPPAATLAAAQTMGPRHEGIDTLWWHTFGDPVLNRLEQRALDGNLDLAEAAARIGRARAQYRIAGAAGLPGAGAGASYQHERASPDGILALTGAGSPPANAAGGADPFGTATLPAGPRSSEYDLFQAGFDASWELDLWVKAHRIREASRADAQAAVLDRDAARISLSAEVAQTYMRLRGAEARLAILRDNRATVAAGQRIAHRRLASGAATRFDAATASAQLAAIDAQLPLAEREAAEGRNALALLAGAEPHALDVLLASAAPTDTQATALPAALPSDFARHRPDIQAAEAMLHAATARIGVARADFYPSVSLTGSAGLQSITLSDFPLWNARQFVAGPILSLPIFRGGRLTGQLELAKADQQVAALRYRATVLRAWHEIDNAIEALRTADARLTATRAGVDESRVAAHVSERRYGAGATGYVDVLVAERARLDREAEWIAARTERAIALTALYKALCGGWTPPAA